jgi:hypothetical protein
MRRLMRIVDRTTRSLANDPLSEREARELLENTRRNVMALFPDKGEEFELIYRPRFERLLAANPGVRCDRLLKAGQSRRRGDNDADN